MVKGTIVEWQFQEILWPRSHVSVISVKTSFFVFVIQFIAFVLFSPVWPIVHSYPVTTVTENASQFSKCFPRLLSTFNSRLRVNGRKRWFSNTMVSYIIYHENYACSVRECYRISIVF